MGISEYSQNLLQGLCSDFLSECLRGLHDVRYMNCNVIQDSDSVSPKARCVGSSPSSTRTQPWSFTREPWSTFQCYPSIHIEAAARTRLQLRKVVLVWVLPGCCLIWEDPTSSARDPAPHRCSVQDPAPRHCSAQDPALHHWVVQDPAPHHCSVQDPAPHHWVDLPNRWPSYSHTNQILKLASEEYSFRKPLDCYDFRDLSEPCL